MIKISSTQNERIKELRRLQKEKDYFWWEGERFFFELIKSKSCPKTLVIEERVLEKFSPYIKKVLLPEETLVVSQKVFSSISQTETPQGIGGLNKRPVFSLQDLIGEGRPLFYLAGVQDPGNVGAIVRVAEAFNFGGLIYEKRGASPFGEKAVRSSAGSILRVKVYMGDISTLHQLQNLGFLLYVLTPHRGEAEDIHTVNKKDLERAIFILGQEGKGVDIALPFSKRLYIPISDTVESLNVAVTAGIVGYITRRLLD